MTRFGMVEQVFEEFAGLFAAVLRDEPGPADEVAKFRRRFPSMRFAFDAGNRLQKTL